MKAVNLLPRDDAKKTRKQTPLPVIVGALTAVVVTAVLCGGFVLESKTVSQKRSDLDAARAELATIPAPQQPNPADIALANEESPRTQALQQALTGRIAWDRMLREIALVVPRDVWLTSLALQAPQTASSDALPPAAGATPAPAAATTTPAVNGFTIEGHAYSHEGVARLLSRLALVPDLDNVTLSSSARTDEGKRSVVTFTVNASIRAPGGAS